MTRWKTWAVVIGMGSLTAPAMALAQQGGMQDDTQNQAPAPSQKGAPLGGDSNQALPQADSPPSDTGANKAIAMSDLPLPVQKTLKREAAGNPIDDIKQTKDIQGNTIFQAEIVKGAQGVNVQVAPDGTLVKKGAPHMDKGDAPQH